MTSREAPVLLRAAGVVGVVALLLFPIVAGMTAVCDDWKYVVDVLRGMTLPQLLVSRLRGDFFRPVDILAATWIDPRTIDGRRVVVLQAVGLLILLFGIRSGLSKLEKHVPLPANGGVLFWLTALWLLFQSGTSVSLWQVDTASQVWAAAIAVWFGVALWGWVERVQRDESRTRAVAAVLSLLIAGLLAKEVFLGWCASGVLLLLGLALRAQILRRPDAVRAFLSLALSIVAITLAYLVARKLLGGLELGYGKYSGSVVVNSLKNLVLALVGGMAVGPIHAVRDPRAYPWIPGLVGASLAAAILLAAAGARLLRRIESAQRGAGWTAACVIFFPLVAISAAFPTSHLSEVYMLGPGVGIGLLLALGLIGLLQVRGIERAVGVLAAVVIVSAGGFGTFARTQQFSITWDNARAVEREAARAVLALPDAGQAVIVTPAARLLDPGYVHSTYVVPAGQLVSPEALQAWLALQFPRRNIRVGTPTDADSAAAVVRLTGTGLRDRPRY
jgi:hypothetical protein